jgi:hypothetical protein
MPIPMGRPGDMDGEGGTTDYFVRLTSMVGSWWAERVPADYRLRVRMEPPGVQPNGAIRGAWSTCPQFMDFTLLGLQPIPLAPEPSVAELPNDADSDGTDGS